MGDTIPGSGPITASALRDAYRSEGPVKLSNFYALANKTTGALRASDFRNKTTFRPPNVTSLYQTIAAGADFTLFTTMDGRLYGVGANASGQLATGNTTAAATPVRGKLNSIIQLAAGLTHGIALLTDGTVRCWGGNGYGQCGNNTTTNVTAAPIDPGLTGVTFVAAGAYHSAAVLSDGTVRVWGYNASGQLGLRTTTNSLVPADPGLTGILSIACGVAHTVAVRSDGGVRVCGSFSNGEFGVMDNSLFSYYKVPSIFPPADMTDYTTTFNNYSYGNGTYIASASSSYNMPNYLPWNAFRSNFHIGTGYSLADGGVYTGTNTTAGYLGQWLQIQLPFKILLTSYSYDTSGVASLFTVADYRVFGSNDGVEWTLINSSPSTQTYYTGYQTTAPDRYFRFYRIAVNKCTGWNGTASWYFKWLLYGIPEESVAYPNVTLRSTIWTSFYDPGFSDIASATCGDGFTILRTSAGRLISFGKNASGQLLNGNTTNSLLPVYPSLRGVARVVANLASPASVGVQFTDGSLRTYGDNTYGQLGAAASGTPSLGGNAAGTGIDQVCLGSNHAFLLRTDGSFRAAGSTAAGQLSYSNYSRVETFTAPVLPLPLLGLRSADQSPRSFMAPLHLMTGYAPTVPGPFVGTHALNFYGTTGAYLSLGVNSTSLGSCEADFNFALIDTTFEAFIYPFTYSSANMGGMGLIGRWQPTANTGDWVWGFTNAGNPIFLYKVGTTVTMLIATSTTVPLNQWSHVALCTTSADTTARLYLNGTRIALGTITGITINQSATLTIGQINNITFPGYIYGVRIVRGTALYQGASYTVPTTALSLTDPSGGQVAYLMHSPDMTQAVAEFDAKASAASLSNPIATINGTLTGVVDGPFAGTKALRLGPVGTFLYFGTGQSTSVGTSRLDFNLTSQDCTVEAWFYMTSMPASFIPSPLTTTPVGYLLGRFQPTADTGDWLIGPDSNGSVTFFAYNNGGANTFVLRSANGAVTTGQWYHIALVYQTATTKFTLYLNGTAVDYRVTAMVFNRTARITIGQANNNAFPGHIFGVRFTQGGAIYTDNFDVPTMPPTRNLGNTTGTVVYLLDALHPTVPVIRSTSTIDNVPMRGNGTLSPFMEMVQDLGLTRIYRSYSHYLYFPSLTFQFSDEVVVPFTNAGFAMVMVARMNSWFGAGNYERFFDFGSGAPSNNMLLGRSGTSTTMYGEFYVGTTATTLASGTIDSAMHVIIYNLAVTTSGTRLVTYIDGLPTITSSTASLKAGAVLSNNYIGRSNWGTDSYSHIDIHRLMVYNRSLSSLQIMSLSDSLSRQYIAAQTGEKAVILTSGTSWTVPSGVTQLRVFVCGGGGAGAYESGGKHGGSAAGFTFLTVAVSAGQVIQFSIGAGGVSNVNGGIGGQTTLNVGGLSLVAFPGRTGTTVGGFSSPSGYGFNGGPGGTADTRSVYSAAGGGGLGGAGGGGSSAAGAGGAGGQSNEFDCGVSSVLGRLTSFTWFGAGVGDKYSYVSASGVGCGGSGAGWANGTAKMPGGSGFMGGGGGGGRGEYSGGSGGSGWVGFYYQAFPTDVAFLGNPYFVQYTGSSQTIQVPTGYTRARVSLWGGGGGSSWGDIINGGGSGGAGGFLKADIAVIPGEFLTVIVGQGGRAGVLGGTATSAFGGGGAGTGNTRYAFGGGGGYSAVRRGGMILLIVGGGGGGGALRVPTGGSRGGAGGGATAQAAEQVFAGYSASGGTLTAGGTGTTNYPGSQFQGGNATLGPGGGGGWYGGAGGFVLSAADTLTGSASGAGGGSSYTAPELSAASVTNLTGSYEVPPGTSETYYQPGVGVGGSTTWTVTSSGGNGMAVFEFYTS